jgi:hypothetical protein
MSAPPVSLRLARAAIEDALAHGAPLDEVEREIIDEVAVGEDARASLWLFAWGTAERGGRTFARRPGGPVG